MIGSALAGAGVSAAFSAEGRISLAAWSLVQSLCIARRSNNLDLPRVAREEFDIGAVEFINFFFENPTFGYLRQSRSWKLWA